MATIREMQAVFKASASNMRAGVQKLRDDFKGLKKESDETGKTMGEKMYAGFDKMQRGGQKIRHVGGQFSKYVTAPLLATGGIAFKAANDIDKAYSIIRTGTGATGDDLEELKESFKTVFADVPDDAELVGTALADLNTRTGLTGEALEGMTKQFLDLGRITGEDVPTLIANGTRVFGDWNIATEDQADTLDYLFKVSQNTGIGVNDLMQKVVQFGSPMRQMGFEFDETAAIMAKFEKEGVNAELVMGSMRQGLGYFAREGIDAREGLMQTIEAIQQAGSESEATGLAMEVFGARAGPDMASAIREGRFDLEELLETIESSPETIGAAAEESETFGQKVSRLFNEMKLAIEPLGTILLEMVEDWMPKVSAAIQAVANWFGELTKQQREWLVILGLIGAAIGPVLLVIGQLMMSLGGIGKVVTSLLPGLGEKGLTGLLKTLASRFSFLFGPVGIAIGLITTLGAVFITAYKKSETFRNFIDGLRDKFSQGIEWIGKFKDGILGLFQDDGMAGIDILTSIGLSQDMAQRLWDITGYFIEFYWQVKEKVDLVKGVLSSMIEMFKGNWTDGRAILEKLGFTPDQIVAIENAVLGIMFRFNNMKDDVSNALSAVGRFFKSTFSDIQVWWSEYGPLITGAISSVFGKAKEILFAILNSIDWNFQDTYRKITKIWDLLWLVVTTATRIAWSTLQTIIGIGMDLIQGIIAATSALIQGDWSKFWQILRDTAGSIKDRIVAHISRMRDLGVEIFGNLVNRGKEWFLELFRNTKSRARDIKDTVVGYFTDLKDDTIDRFQSVVSGAKDMMDGIGDWIDRKREAVVEKATSLGTGIANAAIRGFNKLIRGVNSVGKLLGIDDLLSEIPLIESGGSSNNNRRRSGNYNVARYSTGTDFHKGGAAIVGDKGPGNGDGTREIVSLPNGRNWLFNKETLIDDLPTGAKVLNNKLTEKKFGAGSGTDRDNEGGWVSRAVDWGKDKASSIVSGVSGAFSKVSDFITDVWDYMSNPGELASKLVSNLDLGFQLPQVPLDLATGGVKKLTSGIGDFFGKWFDSAGGEVDGGSILNRAITARFGSYPAHIARQLGVTRHYGLDTAHKYERLTSPVTGKVSRVWHDKFGGNAIQISAGDLTWWFMHMQSIARKVGDMVKAGATNLGVTGNTGLRTTGYHLHTQAMKGGIGNRFAINPLPLLQKIGGYFKGGITSGIPELAWLNEEGFKESVISWNPARKERSEDIWRTTGQQLGFGNDESVEALKEVVKYTKVTNRLLQRVENAIIDKDPVVRVDDIFEGYNSKDTREIQKRKQFTGRVGAD
ncbi:phage tail tape measure protein [Salinicoccus sesuvii]|uniref:lysostaphin n=1 Tax=Salinicoccus sesuvii TaxID=868281 RepID=A0ABV7N8W4_9STAP